MAALLLDNRPGGEPCFDREIPRPLGRLFAFEEIGWLDTEALGLRLRAAWPSSGCAVPGMVIDPHRMAPGFRRLAEHPRLLAAAERQLAGPATLLRSWLTFDDREPLPAPGHVVRLAVDVGGPLRGADRRGQAWLIGTAPLPADAAGRIHFVADYMVADKLVGPHVTADDSLWPTAWSCAG